MVYEWKDKVLLITGASNGIGASVVRKALGEGVQHVVILDVDVENGVALQNELNEKYGADKVKFIKCDVTNEEELRSNFNETLRDKSQQYVVINNAAILNDSLRTYKKEIEINVTALVTGSLLAQEWLRADRGGRGGTIVNVSSVAALCPLPFTPIYNATKSAVLVFSTGLGADEYYKRTQVRVLTICFGVTDTGLVALENLGTFDEELERQLAEPLAKYPGQCVDSAGQSVIDMFKAGASASVWLSSSDRPARDISRLVQNNFANMEPLVFQ